MQFLLGATQRILHQANISLVFSRFFDNFLGLEIKTVLKSNFGSFWCFCGPNFGSFWWLSGAIPTRGHSKNFAPGKYIAGVFAVFRQFFGVGDQDGTEIEFWVILVLLWTEFWVVLVALWCNSYSCGAFKSGKRIKNNKKHLLGGTSQVETEGLLFNKKMSLGAPLRPLKLTLNNCGVGGHPTRSGVNYIK